jgi:hypothetical protein
VDQGGVRAVRLDQREGEGAVHRMVAAGHADPGPRADGSGRADVDQLPVELLARRGVVLDGRHQDPVARAHTGQSALAEGRDEPADDRTEASHIGELDGCLDEIGHVTPVSRWIGGPRRSPGLSRRRLAVFAGFSDP